MATRPSSYYSARTSSTEEGRGLRKPQQAQQPTYRQISFRFTLMQIIFLMFSLLGEQVLLAMAPQLRTIVNVMFVLILIISIALLVWKR
jgi:hypothetical protein